MATNVTQKDKTLQEAIDWCKSQRNDLLVTLADWPVSAAGNNAHYWNKGKLTAYTEVIRHCTAMLGYGGAMPTEVPNQAEDAK